MRQFAAKLAAAPKPEAVVISSDDEDVAPKPPKVYYTTYSSLFTHEFWIFEILCLFHQKSIEVR